MRSHPCRIVVSPASIGYVDVYLTLPHACGSHRLRIRWSETLHIEVRITPTARAGKLPDQDQAVQRADNLGARFVLHDVRIFIVKLRFTHPASAKDSMCVFLVREVVDDLERLAGIQVSTSSPARCAEFGITTRPH